MFKFNFIDRRLVRHFDWGLFGISLLIPLCGLIVLYSAGYDSESSGLNSILPFALKSQAFLKQAMFFLIGLVVLIVGLSLPPQLLYRYAYLIYPACILALVVVLGAGTVVNGSRRWISLGGGFNIQPSEMTKIGLILLLAKYLSRNPPRSGPYGISQLILPTIFILIPMALIMKQPDLGSALSVGGVGALMVLFVGVRPRILVTMLAAAFIAAPFAWHKLHDYQRQRLMMLINPDSDPKGWGYHIRQSIIAVGSGELTGKGYLRGTQTQLEFLPEHTTDFIFSVLAEEWGFFGCVIVLSLYIMLLYRLLRVTARSKDLFAALVSFGVAASFGVNAIINIGMVIGILPVVGIPLPLFSYGGSAVLSMMFALGLALGVSMRRLAFAQGAA